MLFMTLTRFVPWRLAVALPAAGLTAAALFSTVHAQFDPPATVFGSIADSGGVVPAGVAVEAYIGDTLCGTKGRTEFTGDGAARVTVYVVDVVSESQIAGCGVEGREIRVKIGDRFATQTAKWSPGPVQLDVTFGSASPAVIPTFTPAPTRTPVPESTPEPGQTAAPAATVETIPAGSPGAGSPAASPRGGITSATPGTQNASSGGGGGFPIWGVVALILGGIAAVGGGVGYAMSRSSRAGADDDDLDPPLD
jgi:hypothetical protein